MLVSSVGTSLNRRSFHPTFLFLLSPSRRGFPIIWCRQNGIEYHSSTLSCPVRPPPLTPHFP